MKKIIAIVLVLAACFGCASQSSLKKQSADVTIAYKAMTRGRQLNIVYKNDTIAANSGSGMAISSSNTALSATQKEDLFRLLEKVDLDGMQSLKSPTNKRMYDGAMIANITVTVKEKVYESSSFDHGNPPAEIAALVNKLITLGGKE